MYSGARRFGLGDAAAAGADVNDFGSVVAALGLAWNPQLFGFSTWGDAIKWINSGNGLTAKASGGYAFLTPSGVPAAGLVALVHTWEQFRQTVNGYLPSATQVIKALGVSLVSGVPGTGGAVYSPRPPDVPVTDTDWRAYAGSIITWAPVLEKLFDLFAPGEVAPVLQPGTTKSLQQVWADAQKGIDSTPTGAGVAVPTAWITEGPTVFPDGNVGLIYQDPRDTSQYAAGHVQILWWHAPTWKPLQLDANGKQVPGTGDWYTGAIVYDNLIGHEPPPGWNGTYTISAGLLSGLAPGSSPDPRIPTAPINVTVTPSNVTLYRGSDNPVTTFPAPAATPAPAPATQYAPPPLYPPPTAPAPVITPAPATAPPVLYAPVPTVQPPTVANVPPFSIATPPILYQPPTTVGPGDQVAPAAAAPASDTGSLLIGGGLLVLGLVGLIGGQRKRRRRK